jgi:quinol-cytochrome oxidoreductase complex cytochrome b subunit
MRRSLRARLKENPIFYTIHHTLFEYPTPINLNYAWNFGFMALITLILQIITGILLAMYYVPHADLAFLSVEYIMREINSGYLLRFLHANGATMFFIVVYAHTLRNLYYGSYLYPRQLLWSLGLLIKVLMIVTAFLGYVLPWGQMSFWAATVITNLVSVIPYIGDIILWWLWGSFNVDHATLKKFFSLHFLLPFVILFISLLHIITLHQNGSNNPLGIDVPVNATIKFSPYFLIKDYLGLIGFLVLYLFLVLFLPDYAGHPDNYIAANPMVTPAHIVPEWYFLPYYAILRSIENKLLGVIALLLSICILFIIPFLNRPTFRSSGFRPSYAKCIWLFLIVVLYLGYLGGCEAASPFIEMSRLMTNLYFSIFLFLMPWVVSLENYTFDIKKTKRKKYDKIKRVLRYSKSQMLKQKKLIWL